MNRINPIYAGVLLLMILSFLVFKLGSAKDDLVEEKLSYSQTKKISTELSGLKEVYSDKKKAELSLQRVLNIASVKSAKIQKKNKKSGVVISSDGMDINALNALMGKVLNTSYNITVLKIKKLSEDEVSLRMEIKW